MLLPMGEVDPPQAECLICGHVKPLGVWKDGTEIGVCIECRDKARGWT